MKVVINKCFGGFSVSREAAEFMAARGNKRAEAELHEKDTKGQWYGFGYVDGFEGGYERNDPDLVAAVEAMGTAAGSSLSNLKVVEIPDGIDWEIDDYDGMESIAEKHRTWG